MKYGVKKYSRYNSKTISKKRTINRPSNRRFPSYHLPLELYFASMFNFLQIKLIFIRKFFVQGLVPKQRLKVTRKKPIKFHEQVFQTASNQNGNLLSGRQVQRPDHSSVLPNYEYEGRLFGQYSKYVTDGISWIWIFMNAQLFNFKNEIN